MLKCLFFLIGIVIGLLEVFEEKVFVLFGKGLFDKRFYKRFNGYSDIFTELTVYLIEMLDPGFEGTGVVPNNSADIEVLRIEKVSISFKNEYKSPGKGPRGTKNRSRRSRSRGSRKS